MSAEDKTTLSEKSDAQAKLEKDKKKTSEKTDVSGGGGYVRKTREVGSYPGEIKSVDGVDATPVANMGIRFQQELSSNLMNEFDDESMNSMFMLTEEQAETLHKEIKSNIDILGKDDLENGSWSVLNKIGIKSTEKKLTMHASNDEIALLLANLQDTLGPLKKGGIAMNVSPPFISDPRKRVRDMIAGAVRHAENRLRTMEKPATVENEAAYRERTTAILGEIKGLRTLLQQNADFSSDPIIIKGISHLEIVEYAVLMANLVDQKLCLALQARLNDVEANNAFRGMADGKEPSTAIVAVASPFERTMGVSVVGLAVVKRLQMNNVDVSLEHYNQAEEELRKFAFDYNAMGKMDHPWKMSLMELREKYDKALAMKMEFLRQHPEHAGAVQGLIHLFWYLMPKLMATSGAASTYYTKVSPQVQAVYMDAKRVNYGADGVAFDDDGRLIRVETLLIALDAQHSGINNKSKKYGNEEMTLNVNERKALSKSKNRSGPMGESLSKYTEGKLCSTMMRGKECTDDNCQYNFVSKQRFENQLACPLYKKGGSCRFGETCVLKHPGDGKYVWTSSKSVHQPKRRGESTNQVLKSKDVDGGKKVSFKEGAEVESESEEDYDEEDNL